jgi:enoyl-[acyl-carrier protein] reductase III
VLTDALRHLAGAQEETLVDEVVARTPAGRLVTPEDVAQLVAFLCTPAAGMVRGQVIVIDGGYTLPG